MLGGIHPEADPFWYAQGQGLGYGEASAITARRMIEAVAAEQPRRAAQGRGGATRLARDRRGLPPHQNSDAWVTVPKAPA